MKLAVKLEIVPDKADSRILDGQSKICNWLYNHLLETANNLRNHYRENRADEIASVLYTKRGLRDLIPDLKKEHPFLKTVWQVLNSFQTDGRIGVVITGR